MNHQSKKIAFLGLSAAAALILSYVENMLPPLSSLTPGIKLGLSNTVIIFVLYSFGVRDALSVSFVRIASISLLFGNTVLFAYSASGALLSIITMAILKKTKLFSAVGVSVAGGIAHNLGQILMAMLLLNSSELLYYMLILTVTGTVAGIFVGLCAVWMIRRIALPQNDKYKSKEQLTKQHI